MTEVPKETYLTNVKEMSTDSKKMIVKKSSENIFTVIVNSLKNNPMTPTNLLQLFPSMKKQNLNYYLSELSKNGLIEKHKMGRITEYVVTKLLPSKNGDILGVLGLRKKSKFVPKSIFRLHNLELECIILNDVDIRFKKSWDLGKWCGFRERIGDITVRFNPPTKKIIFYLQSWGRTPEEALINATNKVNFVQDEIKKRYPNILLSGLKVNRKAHLTVPTHKQIKTISERVQISAEDWKIDESEGHGELEFVDDDLNNLITKATNFVNGTSVRGETITELRRNIMEIREMVKGSQTNTQAILNIMTILTGMIKTWMEREK